jgi:hypothetical protein
MKEVTMTNYIKIVTALIIGLASTLSFSQKEEEVNVISKANRENIRKSSNN